MSDLPEGEESAESEGCIRRDLKTYAFPADLESLVVLHVPLEFRYLVLGFLHDFKALVEQVHKDEPLPGFLFVPDLWHILKGKSSCVGQPGVEPIFQVWAAACQSARFYYTLGEAACCHDYPGTLYLKEGAVIPHFILTGEAMFTRPENN